MNYEENKKNLPYIFKIKNKNEIYIGHWKLCINPIYLILILISQFLFFFNEIQEFKNKSLNFLIITFIILYIFFWIITLIIGPGYLPYNFLEIFNKKEIINNLLQKDYLALEKDQLLNSKLNYIHDLIPFSIKSKRYIINPIFFDFYSNNWIGLKNNFYFFIQNILNFLLNLLYFFYLLKIFLNFDFNFGFDFYFYKFIYSLIITLIFSLKSFSNILFLLFKFKLNFQFKNLFGIQSDLNLYLQIKT